MTTLRDRRGRGVQQKQQDAGVRQEVWEAGEKFTGFHFLF
jgi:hypothetical protein